MAPRIVILTGAGVSADSGIPTFRDENGEPGALLKHLRLEIYAGDRKKRNRMVERWQKDGFPHFAVMTYQLFRKEFSIFVENGYEYVVADEANLLNNPRTDTHLGVHYFLGDKYGEKGLLAMDGSPANNQLIDLWGKIKLITPNAYLSTHDFYMQHVDVEDITVSYQRDGETMQRSVEKITGYRNREYLFQNFYRQARRVETREVQELPELNIETVEVDLSKQHMDQYRQLVNEKILFFEDGSMIEAVAASKLRQLCAQSVNNPSEIGLECDSAVLEMADSLLASANVAENKVVVFCHYRKTVERLRERWAKLNPATIYGGADNDKQRDKFLDDESCRVALINYQSGGFGLELQHVAKTVICVEPTGVPGHFRQSIKRVHREGQKDKVNVYVLIASGTVFAKLFRDMEEKQSSNDSVVSRAQLLRELLGEDTTEAVAVP